MAKELSTYSFNVANKCNHDHNNRQITNNKRIDVTRSEYNVKLKDDYEGIRGVESHRNLLVKSVGEYEINGKSVNEYVQEYNDSQSRSDRKTTLRQEMDKLKSNREGGLVRLGREHEMIFQIGKADEDLTRSEDVKLYGDSLFDLGDDLPTYTRSDYEIQNAVMRDIYDELERSFGPKGFKITQCYIHNDETTPHMHVSFITIQEKAKRADGKVFGVQVDFSFDNWCNRNFGSFGQFRENLEAHILDKCQAHGLEIKKNGKFKGKHYHQDKYTELRDKINEAKAEHEQLTKQSNELNKLIQEKNETIQSIEKEKEALKQEASKNEERVDNIVNKAVKTHNENLIQQVANQTADRTLYNKLEKTLDKYENNSKEHNQDQDLYINGRRY